MTRPDYIPDVDSIAEIARHAVPASPALAARLLESPGAGLSYADIASLLKGLLAPDSQGVSSALREAGADLRQKLYGNAVIPMAPVEVANTCVSDCVFCGWRVSNRSMKRLRMPADLVLMQVDYLVSLGIHYIELVSGDDIGVVRDVFPELIRGTRKIFDRHGVAGKVNFCTLALTEDQYLSLREAGGDAMIVWQEAYDPAVYRQHILSGPKHTGIGNEWKLDRSGDGWRFRLESQERALRAGVEVALGTMLGLNPDIVTEVLCVVDHARYLTEEYGATAEHPIIIGMPTWNSITTPETDKRPGAAPTMPRLFADIAALYLLALPSPGTWVFPNCRVPLRTQIEAARVGGVFTSTEVKLGPGGYLPSILRRAEARGEDTSSLRKRIAELLREAGDDIPHLEAALDQREQFIHHYHAHEVYCREMQAAGLEVISGIQVPEVLPLTPVTD